MNVDATQPIKRRNRFFGLIIIAAIVLPMILAYAIFKTGIGFPSGTTNKGELLSSPQDITDLMISGENNTLSTIYQSDQKRWRILVPVTQECNEVCQSHLYITRQVHIRLAEKAYRVERILLLLNPLSDKEIETLKQEHPTTLLIESTPEDFRKWLDGVTLPLPAENYFYLIDQSGFAMMRYSTEHSGHDLLDDLKKLLKFTYDK